MAENERKRWAGEAGPGEDFEDLGWRRCGWNGKIRVLRREGAYFLAAAHHEGSMAFGRMTGLQVYERTPENDLRFIAEFEVKKDADLFLDRVAERQKAP